MSHMQQPRRSNHNNTGGDLHGHHHPTSLNVNPLAGGSGIPPPGHVVYPYPWTVYPYGVPPSSGPPPPVSPSPPYNPTAGVLRHRYYAPYPRTASQQLPPPYQHHHMPSSPAPPVPQDNGGHRAASVNGAVPSPVEAAPSISDLPLKDQCDAVFRHPLFPMLRLLLEKLEESTLSAVTPGPDSINAELDSLARRIPSFNTSNPEIDDLMVQGVSILRLHLFELEKVNELCRDFCNRYAECLRRNLHTDQILRNDGMDSETSDGSISMSPNGMPHHSPMPPMPHNPAMYQMMNVPQNLVAQPMPMHMQMSSPEPSSHRNMERQTLASGELLSFRFEDQEPAASLLGSSEPTTMGAQADNVHVGDMMLSPMSGHSHYDEDKFDQDMDDSSSPKANRASRRGILPKEAINVMKSWLFQHIVHPYPTEDEKRILATQTRLSMLQVNNWFINARRRILQPMLDATNPGGHRPKKGMQSRPVDPFWSESAVPAAGAPSQPSPSTNPQSDAYYATKTENGLPDEPSDDDRSQTGSNRSGIA